MFTSQFYNVLVLDTVAEYLFCNIWFHVSYRKINIVLILVSDNILVGNIFIIRKCDIMCSMKVFFQI